VSYALQAFFELEFRVEKEEACLNEKKKNSI